MNIFLNMPKTLIGKKWRLEDVSESIMAWIYIKCKSDRIPKKKYDKIVKTIPKGIKYLDRQNVQICSQWYCN